MELAADESALTGESVPAEKDADAVFNKVHNETEFMKDILIRRGEQDG